MSTRIEDRFILVLREGESQWGFWSRLEEATKIPAYSWRKAYARKQRPTSEMIEALCRLLPTYAFWIATGITDAENGHCAPESALTFPELPRSHKPWALLGNEFFAASLRLASKLYEEARVDLEDDNARLKAAERQQIDGMWWGSHLVECAYNIAGSDDYREFTQARDLRQERRAAFEAAITGDAPLDSATPEGLTDVRTQHQGTRDLHWIARPTSR